MTSVSKVKSWDSTPANSRISRTYTEFTNDVVKTGEPDLKKGCKRCNIEKKHVEYRVVSKKDKEGNILGVFRNNNCRVCEKKSPNSKSTVATLEKEISDLKDLLNTKDAEMKGIKKTMEANFEMFNRSLEELASFGGYKIDDKGKVSLRKKDKSYDISLTPKESSKDHS